MHRPRLRLADGPEHETLHALPCRERLRGRQGRVKKDRPRQHRQIHVQQGDELEPPAVGVGHPPGVRLAEAPRADHNQPHGLPEGPKPGALLPMLPGDGARAGAKTHQRVSALRTLIPRRPVEVIRARRAEDVFADLGTLRDIVDGRHDRNANRLVSGLRCQRAVRNRLRTYPGRQRGTGILPVLPPNERRFLAEWDQAVKRTSKVELGGSSRPGRQGSA